MDSALIKDMAELLYINPKLTNEDLAVRFETTVDDILMSRKMITKDLIKEVERGFVIHDEDGVGGICISIPSYVKPFRPTAKDYIGRDGHKYKDVSEFFGIIEYGGACYGKE